MDNVNDLLDEIENSKVTPETVESEDFFTDIDETGETDYEVDGPAVEPRENYYEEEEVEDVILDEDASISDEEAVTSEADDREDVENPDAQAAAVVKTDEELADEAYAAELAAEDAAENKLIEDEAVDALLADKGKDAMTPNQEAYLRRIWREEHAKK